MEVWLNSENGNTAVDTYVDRIWTGKAPDVAVVDMGDHRSQDEAISMMGMVPWVLAKCSDWRMIPLENLVASSRDSGTRIAVEVNAEMDINGAAFALEFGADAILVGEDLLEAATTIAGDKNPISGTDKQMSDYSEVAQISSVVNGGIGERVCIDLTRRLEKGQGMAIGSIAGMLCIIHGETVPSEFVPTRPFRVNAGAIHSYVLMADGKTKYLHELSSGDEVAILSCSGIEGSAIIGRLKIEVRPLLLVRFQGDIDEGQTTVQHAETVRFVTPDGSHLSVTEANSGDEISVFRDNRARHIGLPIDGRMSEK